MEKNIITTSDYQKYNNNSDQIFISDEVVDNLR